MLAMVWLISIKKARQKWSAPHIKFQSYSFSVLTIKALGHSPVLYEHKHGMTVVMWIPVVLSVAQFRQYSTIRLKEVTKYIDAEIPAG